MPGSWWMFFVLRRAQSTNWRSYSCRSRATVCRVSCQKWLSTVAGTHWWFDSTLHVLILFFPLVPEVCCEARESHVVLFMCSLKLLGRWQTSHREHLITLAWLSTTGPFQYLFNFWVLLAMTSGSRYVTFQFFRVFVLAYLPGHYRVLGYNYFCAWVWPSLHALFFC